MTTGKGAGERERESVSPNAVLLDFWALNAMMKQKITKMLNYTTVQKFEVCKMFSMFLKESLLLTNHQSYLIKNTVKTVKYYYNFTTVFYSILNVIYSSDNRFKLI